MTRNIDRKRSCLIGGAVSIIVVALVLLLLPGAAYSAPDNWTDGAGPASWSSAGNWDGGIPVSTSDVVINRSLGATVTLGTSTTINSLTLGTNASNILQWVNDKGYALTISNVLTVNSGSSMIVTEGSGHNSLTLAGQSTNNGTITINWGSTAQVSSGATLTNNGTINVTGKSDAGATLKVFDDLTNNGTINVGPTSLSTLYFDSGTAKQHTLNGTGGTITLQGGNITSTTTGSSLNIGSGQTVNGYGTVGDAKLKIVNNGTINATSNILTVSNLDATTTYDSTSKILKTGTWQATGGGQLKLPGTVTENQAKILLDGNTSHIYATTSGTDDALTSFATNSGTFTIQGGKTFTTATNFNNTNTGTLKASGTGSILTVAGLNSSTFSGNTLLTGAWQAQAGGIIRLPTGTDIQTTAFGTTVVLDTASSHIYNGSGSTDAFANFATNNGLFIIATGHDFSTAGGLDTFLNTGVVNIFPLTTFTIPKAGGTYKQTGNGNSTIVLGTLTAPNFDIEGGVLDLRSGGALGGTPTVALSATGIFSLSGGTANINNFNYSGGTLTNTGGTGSIANFNYMQSGGTSVPTALNQFTVTNFTQSAGSLTFSPLTLQTTPGAGTYTQYNLQAGGTLNGDVSLNTGGTFNQTGGTANIGTFSYNGGTLTIPASAAGTIGTFNYNKSGTATLPTNLNQFNITNFNQLAGDLTISALTLTGTPTSQSGQYVAYSLQGGTLTAATVQLNSGGTYDQQASGTASVTDFNYNGGGITQAAGATGGKTTITNFNYYAGALPSTWDRLAIANFYQMAGNPDFTSLVLPAIGSGGYSTYNLQGGTLNPTTITLNSGSTFKQSGGTLNYTTFNQNGGTADFSSVSPLNISSSQTYNLGGGELKAVNVANSGAFNFSGGAMTSDFANSGTGTATVNGSVPSTVSGAVTNAGTFDIQTAFSITSPNSYIQTAGLTKLNGTITAAAVNIAGGTLRGTGTINAPVTVGSGGTVEPGNSPGTLAVNGSYTQAGVLNMEILNINSYDKLNVTGVADFTGGTINVTLLTDYVINPNEVYELISYTSRAGSLPTLNLPHLDGINLVGNFGANGLSVTASSVPIPATVWLLATGLVGMVAVRRRRGKQRTEGRPLR